MAYTRLPLDDLSPSVAAMDVAYRRTRYAESLSNCVLGQFARKVANGSHLIEGKFGGVGFFAEQKGAVHRFVSFILKFGRPLQMIGISATFVSLTTNMRCFVSIAWWLPMGNDAHCARSGSPSAPEVKGTIAVSSICERPDEAFRTLIGGMFLKPCGSGSRSDSARLWRAVAAPAVVVRGTPSSATLCRPMGVLVAAINGACFEVSSHVRSFRDRLWSEPALARQRRAGSLSKHSGIRAAMGVNYAV